jgi:hypothetical protein
MKLYVFGYGSLMNSKSLAKALPEPREIQLVNLGGYVRKFNIPVNGYLYLNLIEQDNSVVTGALIPVTETEFEQLKLRERGYECVEITSQLEESVDGQVFMFIAPDASYPELKIPRSYLLTCMQELSEYARKDFLEEAVIENEIEEDAANPVYENAIFW